MTAVIFSELTDDDDPHGDLIDMLDWDDPPEPGECLVPAFADEINKGVLDENGNRLAIPSFMFVDDSFLGAIRRYMRRLLNAMIAAIFLVMGERDDTIRRQCHLALDKWKGLLVAPRRFIYIGLLFNTRKMTVGITDEYRFELIALIDKPWHRAKKKKTFTAKELQELIGKMARIGEACRWIFYLLPHLYASVNYALKESKRFFVSCSPSFRKLLRSIKVAKSSNLAEANFAMRTTAQKTHRCGKQYFINETLRDEIAAIREIIGPESGVSLESAIGHMVKRSATYTGLSDACMYGAGGYSIQYRYWWHWKWPEQIFKNTTKFLKGKDAIDINVLEFIGMIINYAGALVAIETDGLGIAIHFPSCSFEQIIRVQLAGSLAFACHH
jgi:hypothetical protein